MEFNRSYLRKNVRLLVLSFILLTLFQNCLGGGGSLSDSSVSSSSTNPPPDDGGNPNTPTVPNPCPPAAQGNPEISQITLLGTSTVATVVNAKSGYTMDSGNAASTPILELSLLATNVTPADVCDPNVAVQCSIAIDSGATGVLWGTSDRVPISNNDFQCTVSNQDLDIDVPTKAPTPRPSKTTLQIQPRNQTPDINSNTHVCMQGSASVTVRLRSTYNKDSASRTFKVNFTNTCPKEQKVNAELEAEAQGLFGESVSVSGTRAAVLTTGLNAYSLSNIGGVRIYEYNGSSWVYTTTLIPPSAELENDVKPTTVLLNGSNLFLGNAAINSQAGRVWLFQRDGSGNWSKAQTLNGSASSKFGMSLAFESNRLFVGAPSISGTGSVQIYTLSGSSLSFTSSVSGTDSLSDFGASIAVSGTRLVVGAPGSAANTTTTGNFFSCSIANIASPTCTAWVLTDNKIGGETIPLTSRLGSSVALKNNFLLVSAKNWYPSTMTTAPAIRNGLVALIDLNIGTTAVKIFKGANEELYGAAIAFSNSSFFIGAKEAIARRGRVVQMALPGDGTVNATMKYNYYGLNQGPSDRFGSSLSVSGNLMVVGAPLDQEAGFSTAGSATFFDIIAP